MLSKRYADMLSEKDIIFEIAGMAKRRVSEIVAKRNGFGQIFIQIQCPRNRTGDLGHLERVRQAGTVMVALRSEKHLRFVFHSAKSF